MEATALTRRKDGAAGATINAFFLLKIKRD
jgi:hypothetical protein